MKLCFRLFFNPVALAAAISISSSTLADNHLSDGVIHFRGAIVESACEATVRLRHIDMTCLEQGNYQTSQYLFNNEYRQESVNEHILTASLEHHDPQHNIAIYTIEYR